MLGRKTINNLSDNDCYVLRPELIKSLLLQHGEQLYCDLTNRLRYELWKRFTVLFFDALTRSLKKEKKQ